MTVKITTGIFLCVLVTLAGCATAKDAEMSEGTAKTLTSVTAYDTIGKNFSGGSVTITPDKPDALYSLGEECLFHAEIKDADGNVIPTGIAEVLIYSNYAMPVKMNIPFSPEQPLQIKASSLEPGFTAIEVRYPAGKKNSHLPEPEWALHLGNFIRSAENRRILTDSGIMRLQNNRKSRQI